ncbi:hypothetical protein GF367_00360 [Candidatus Woesearchaeota archaeon]|nr:hypothetical protein [Candidatus Woesearchaeota archaeon]
MSKKAQASMEYINTYIYAGLALVVVVGTIAYFGAFDKETYTKEGCESGAQLSCAEAQVTTEGSISVLIQNKLNQPINVTSITMHYQNQSYTKDVNIRVQPFENAALSVQDTSLTFIKGRKQQFTYTFSYVTDAAPDREHTIRGTATTKVVDTEEFTEEEDRPECCEEPYYTATSMLYAYDIDGEGEPYQVEEQACCADPGVCVFDGQCHAPNSVITVAPFGEDLQFLCPQDTGMEWQLASIRNTEFEQALSPWYPEVLGYQETPRVDDGVAIMATKGKPSYNETTLVYNEPLPISEMSERITITAIMKGELVDTALYITIMWGGLDAQTNMTVAVTDVDISDAYETYTFEKAVPPGATVIERIWLTMVSEAGHDNTGMVFIDRFTLYQEITAK